MDTANDQNLSLAIVQNTISILTATLQTGLQSVGLLQDGQQSIQQSDLSNLSTALASNIEALGAAVGILSDRLDATNVAIATVSTNGTNVLGIDARINGANVAFAANVASLTAADVALGARLDATNVAIATISANGANVSGFDSRINAANAALASNVTILGSRINAANAALAANVASLTAADVALGARLDATNVAIATISANGANVSGFDSRINAANAALASNVTILGSRINAANAALAANVASLTAADVALGARLDATNVAIATISANGANVSAFDSKIDGANAALASNVTILGSRIDGANTALASNVASLTAADVALGARLDATAVAIATISANGANVSAFDSKIDGANAALASNVTILESRIDGANIALATNVASLTAADISLGARLDATNVAIATISANGANVSAFDSRINGANAALASNVTILGSRINGANTTIASTSSTVTSLNNSVTTLNTRVVRLSNQWTTSPTWHVFGDSISFGLGVTSGTYSSLIASSTGTAVENKAVSSTTLDYMYMHYNYLTGAPTGPGVAGSSIIMYGFNDVRNNKALYNTTWTWMQTFLAALLIASVPREKIVRATSFVTRSGTWLATPNTFYDGGLYTTTNGAYIEKTISGRYLDVCFATFTQAGGTPDMWQVSWVVGGGSSQVSVIKRENMAAEGLSPNATGGHQLFSMLIDTGTSSAKTVRITNIATTNAQNRFINHVTGFDANEPNARAVLACSILRFDYTEALAAPWDNPSEEKRLRLNEAIKDAVLTCRRAGLPVFFHQTNTANWCFQTDKVHLSNDWHRMHANDIMTYSM